MYLVTVALPNRNAPGGFLIPTSKYVAVLRGGRAAASELEVPVIIASTDRRVTGQKLRPFEVAVGIAEGFNHATILDCRWVYTLEKSQLPAANHRFRLSDKKMGDVSVALVSGLQMYAPPASKPVAN